MSKNLTRSSLGFDRKQPADIVVVQDDHDIWRDMEKIEGLQTFAPGFSIKTFNDAKEMFAYLDRLADKAKAPDAYFLDAADGVVAGARLVNWFKANCPDRALPEIHFLSISVSGAAQHAESLRFLYPGVHSDFCDCSEPAFVGSMTGKFLTQNVRSFVFRDLLNRKLHTSYALDHDEKSRETNRQEAYAKRGNLIPEVVREGHFPARQAVRLLKDYANELIDSAESSGIVATQEMESLMHNLDQRISFYERAAAPYIGPAVFRIEDVDQVFRETGIKPVLFLQSYDPAVIPLMEERSIGGLVVTSPYMAAHLKMTCDAKNVSGLFGMMSEGEDLSSTFDELARPDGPSYFENEEALIAGQLVARGQMVALGVEGSILALNLPDFPKEHIQLSNNSSRKVEKMADLRDIAKIMEKAYEQDGEYLHKVKMNMDRNVWGFGGDIGLIRTEAWIVDNQEQSALLKKILLDGDDEALRQLSVELKQDYYGLPSNRSVRIRLFDLSPRELMTSEEQKEFSRKFGNLDVRGGAALQAWPQLYREQIRTLCLLMMDRQYMKNPPLEIMMPEIKTEADVIAIKKMIKEEADNAGLEQGRHYRFGVMAETLRCCQNIEKIVPHCDFISFGTNDLSQEFFGIDRGNLLARSQFSSKNGYDPFKTLGSSVFDLMKDVIAKARRIKSDIEIDVCGAHAEDLSTAVALFDSGIDNISVAPTDRNLCILPIRIGYHRLDRDHPQEDLRLKATEGLQL